jgi:mono/diheme cytochrome c family protein
MDFCRRIIRQFALATGALGAAISLPAAVAAADPQASPPSFTAEQANRGQSAYQANCQDCHGSHLDNGEFGGPPLRGSYFRQHWGSGTVDALFGYLRLAMPPDRPGRLSTGTYADLTAFLLSENGYQPNGTELPDQDDQLQHMMLKQ